MEKEILALGERMRLVDASPEPDTSQIIRELISDDVLIMGPQGQIFTKDFGRAVLFASRY
jgi:hypothetical protein